MSGSRSRDERLRMTTSAWSAASSSAYGGGIRAAGLGREVLGLNKPWARLGVLLHHRSAARLGADRRGHVHLRPLHRLAAADLLRGPRDPVDLAQAVAPAARCYQEPAMSRFIFANPRWPGARRTGSRRRPTSASRSHSHQQQHGKPGRKQPKRTTAPIRQLW